eukprot:519102-Rhodomonas_salina.4
MACGFLKCRAKARYRVGTSRTGPGWAAKPELAACWHWKSQNMKQNRFARYASTIESTLANSVLYCAQMVVQLPSVPGYELDQSVPGYPGTRVPGYPVVIVTVLCQRGLKGGAMDAGNVVLPGYCCDSKKPKIG